MSVWQLSGPIASVDWCEPNYVHSPLVAEWWNTWSSLLIALAGLVGALRSRRVGGELRFLVGYLMILVVGLGSAAFHGTLLKLAQAADELPMIATGLVFVYAVRWRSSGPGDRADQRRWQVALASYVLAFSVAYFAIPAYFVFFLLTYSALVAYLVVRTWSISFRQHPDPTRRRLFLVSAGSYVGGVVVLWVPEHLLLGCDHPTQALQLHAVFHLTSAVGSYTWLRWAMWDRALVRGMAEDRDP